MQILVFLPDVLPTRNSCLTIETNIHAPMHFRVLSTLAQVASVLFLKFAGD